MSLKTQGLLGALFVLCILAPLTEGLRAHNETVDQAQSRYRCVNEKPALNAELETFAGESRIDPECEGDGCAQVTINWDEAKQQYKIQNNSADRWVKVEANNLVVSSSACVPPTKTAHLSLTTIVGAVRANLAEDSCGRKP